MAAGNPGGTSIQPAGSLQPGAHRQLQRCVSGPQRHVRELSGGTGIFAQRCRESASRSIFSGQPGAGFCGGNVFAGADSRGDGRSARELDVHRFSHPANYVARRAVPHRSQSHRAQSRQLPLRARFLGPGAIFHAVDGQFFPDCANGFQRTGDQPASAGHEHDFADAAQRVCGELYHRPPRFPFHRHAESRRMATSRGWAGHELSVRQRLWRQVTRDLRERRNRIRQQWLLYGSGWFVSRGSV